MGRVLDDPRDGLPQRKRAADRRDRVMARAEGRAQANSRSGYRRIVMRTFFPETSMKRSLRLFLIAAALLVCSTSPFAQLVIPEIPYDSAPNLLKGFPEDTYLGEAVGVATNSQGHIFVYSRTNSVQVTLGSERTFVRGNGGARLFEFDQTGKWVREIGQGLYGFVFAHVVRIDPQDNIWVVDEGANQVIKFNPQGQVAMILGRKPEAITVPGGE